MDSTRGEFILNGQHRFHVEPQAMFAMRKNWNNGVAVFVQVGNECWYLDFTAPNAGELELGRYENAMRYPFELSAPTRPGLDVGGGVCGAGSGENELSGTFEIKELVWTDDHTSIASFHASFTQFGDGWRPPLRGEIFVNSSDPLPPVHRVLSPASNYSTKGQLFRYQITSTEESPQYEASSLPPGLSLDTSTGLISGIPTSVGTFTTEIGVKSPAGRFSMRWSLVTDPPYKSTGPHTALEVFSELGDRIGQSKSYVLTPFDGTFAATLGLYRYEGLLTTTAWIVFHSWAALGDQSSEGYWGIYFLPSPGQQLQPGDYRNTSIYGQGPQLMISSETAAGNPSGNFSISQIATDGFDRIQHFRGLFHQSAAYAQPWVHVWAWLNAENVITSRLHVNGNQGVPFQYQIIANNDPLGFSASGLPPGLSVNPSNGLISGTTQSYGDFTVRLTATGSMGNASDDLTLHLRSARSFKNISTRVRVGTDTKVAIGGFIIVGSTTKHVLIRGLGPSLRRFGLNQVLENPTLELRDSSGGLMASNDDWITNQSAIEATGIPPIDAAESAILTDLAPGAYTAILAGKNGTSGIGLVEVYDLDGASDASFGNISTRGRVGLEYDDAMIGGIIIAGGTGGMSRVVFRGIGWDFAHATPLELIDPILELHDVNGTLIAQNDNWTDTQGDEVDLTTLAPADPRHPAIVVSLPSGSYTAIVRGKGQDQGIALVEAYNLDAN